MNIMRFGTVPMLAVTVVAALGFYTLTLTVSAERTEVERLQRQIASGMSDVRTLEAELKTRARLPVLQKWNDEVLALGAPLPKQFVDAPVQLAAYAPGLPDPVAAEPAVQLAVVEEAPAPAPAAATIQKTSYEVAATTPKPAPKAAAAPDPLGGLIGDIEQAAAAERKTLVRKVSMQ
jgi:hypothetical protein